MSTSTSIDEQLALERCRRPLQREINSLRRSVARLEAVASEVVSAETWDQEVYGTAPGPGWLMIDRASWARMMAAVDEVDAWRPWSTG